MLLAAATSSQLLNLPVLQLPCPVSCTCCEGPTGPTSGTRRILFVATSKTTPMAFFSACSSCNIATARSVRHDKSAAAARSLPGSRSKAVDGGWGGGENSCREPFSQVRRVHGATLLPSAVGRFWLGYQFCFGHLGASSDRDLASPGLLGVRWDGPASGSTWGGPAAHQRPADGGATYVSPRCPPGGNFFKSEYPVWF